MIFISEWNTFQRDKIFWCLKVKKPLNTGMLVSTQHRLVPTPICPWNNTILAHHHFLIALFSTLLAKYYSVHLVTSPITLVEQHHFLLWLQERRCSHSSWKLYNYFQDYNYSRGTTPLLALTAGATKQPLFIEIISRIKMNLIVYILNPGMLVSTRHCLVPTPIRPWNNTILAHHHFSIALFTLYRLNITRFTS